MKRITEMNRDEVLVECVRIQEAMKALPEGVSIKANGPFDYCRQIAAVNLHLLYLDGATAV